MRQKPAPSILITRPEPQATALGRALSALDYSPVILPLVDFCAHPPEVSLPLRPVSTVIATSPRAVDFGLPWLLKVYDSASYEALNNLPIKWFSMGPETAQHIKQAGLRVKNIPLNGLNSEQLLGDPQVRNMKAGEHCLILKGVGGRTHLAQVLRERGIVITEANVYKRVLPLYTQSHLKSVLTTAPDCLTVTSGEILGHLVSLLKCYSDQPWQGIPLLVVGTRQQDMAKSYGFKQVFAATAADNDTLLKTLNQRLSTKFR